jgi:hypothetical protein
MFGKKGEIILKNQFSSLALSTLSGVPAYPESSGENQLIQRALEKTNSL